MSDIIRFDIARIQRDRKKLCQCGNPHYDIDIANRIVECRDCGAVMDAFDVLVRLAERGEQIERLEKTMLEKAKAYGEMASDEFNRMIKSRIFRDMQSHYRKNMFPVCPECGEPFDPVKIGSWTRNRKDTENHFSPHSD